MNNLLPVESIQSEFSDLKPLPETLLPVEPFNLELMPGGSFSDFIHDISERMQCPPDYVAVTVMTMLSTVIGKSYQIKPKKYDDGWCVVCNLWALILGRPSTLKSPAMEEAIKPLKRAEIDAKKEYDDAFKSYQIDVEFADINKKTGQTKIKELIKNNNKVEARALMESTYEEIEKPIRRRFIVIDTTIEKLGELLNENTNGLLHKRDELSGFLKTIDSENRPNDRAFYLEAFNGSGSYCYDRVGRGTIDIESMTLSMIGTIQPGRFAGYVGAAIKQGHGDDGLAQRFQLSVYPDEPKRWENIDRYSDKSSKNKVYDTITVLIERIKDIVDPVILSFSPEGQRVFNEWREELENTKLRNTDDHPALLSHLAKYRSLMPSLALIIHIVDEYQVSEISPVSERAAIKASAWCEYLESHARRIYSAATNNPVDIAQLILSKIRNKKLESGFTARIIQNKNWSGLTVNEEIKQGLSLLDEHNYLRQELVKTGGRDSVTYCINPQLLKDLNHG